MEFIVVVFLIILISLVLAARSMKDFDIPKELRMFIDSKRIRGTIVFFKEKIKHYSSSSGSSV